MEEAKRGFFFFSLSTQKPSPVLEIEVVPPMGTQALRSPFSCRRLLHLSMCSLCPARKQ